MSDPIHSLHRKRDGLELSAAEISAFIRGVTSGAVSDAQLGAFTMAVCLRGMSAREQAGMTLAMRDSGTVLTWPDVAGPVLDKHSTGGVGDMVSLILGPLLAACGAFVPMISGRALGHTGGTLDKLESIAGFDAFPDLDSLRAQVRRVGIAIVGQTDELVPADRRMYATRGISSTVASIPLIVSSILSKKLAEGLDGLVLDVKSGNGAFLAEADRARELALQATAVAQEAGLPCSVLITDMNQPLAWTAGNALEVGEVLRFWAGTRHARLEAVTMALGAAALSLRGLSPHPDAAHETLRAALDSGAAAEVFARMVAAQGGPCDLLERPQHHLVAAPVRRPLLAGQAGWVASMDTRGIGLAVVGLGGGRRRDADKIDHRVGLSGLCSVGDPVSTDTELAIIHAANEQDWQRAAATLRLCIDLSAAPARPLPTIHERIEWNDNRT